jgi:hypothetical protein
MINRHTTFFVKDLKPIEFCGNPVMWQMDINGAFEKPFETQPIEGEHDFNTCEGCKKTLKELIKRLTEKFEGNHKDGAKPFPFCCTHHSELTKLKEFNRADFISVPEMVARKIIYTNSHIKNNHQTETYYKDITDYIDYTVESFGQMPGNAEPLYLSDYFFYITDLLERNTEVEKGRKNRLLEFLKAYRTPTETPKTDFNILLGTYQKWLKVFPFEISFFSTLKPHFEKQLPILNGKPETNKYTGIAKVKMHTKGSLIDVLLNLTNNLLTQINTATLYEKGLLTEPQKIKLELVLNERKMKLKQGYVNSSKDEEQRYRKILKEWFADEKRFIDEVTPIVKELPPQPIVKQKPEPNGKLITFKNSETIEKIHSELKGYFPNKEVELLKALQGEQLSELLLFPHNQNKFVEVFRRLKYNGFLLNTDTETKNWICTNFQFVKKGFAEPQPFNESSVWDNLNKGKGEPTKKERICITEWLPYKSPLQLTRETENEKL